MDTIKYRYAKTNDGILIDVNDLSKANVSNDKYYCLGCEKLLIPKLGVQKQKHFAHLKVSESCSSETYLHNLAKNVLYTNIQNRIINNQAFYLEYYRQKQCIGCSSSDDDICTQDDVIEKKDILQRYRSVGLEKQQLGFRADVILETIEDSLLFEICVTHRCDEEKLLSGLKIVEIDIENEEEISKLRNDYIKINNISIRSNIIIKPIKIDLCKYGACTFPVFYFVVYRSGKAIFLETTVGKMQIVSNSIAFKKKYHNARYTKVDFVSDVIEAYRSGIKISNCHLCRYHALNRSHVIDGNLVFCKYKKQTLNSNSAAECEAFRIDDNSFTRI